jgi:predicted metal-dependent hydrolase
VSDAVAEPQLTSVEREAFDRGMTEFDAGRYFECHDTLEDLWSGIRGPSRDFFQGLIQVAVAFHHLGNGNRAGAASLLEKALGRLERYGDVYLGMDLVAHRTELRSWLERARSGTPVSLEPRPTWRVHRAG